MWYLTLGEVAIIEGSGGATGIRDLSGLESALAQPRATFGGRDLHTSLTDKAAALCFSLVRDHPFVDGNKRATLASALAHQFFQIDVDTPGAHASDCHLDKGPLDVGKPLFVRRLKLVGIGGEFAETSPLVPSVPRDTRDSGTAVQVLLHIPYRSFDVASTARLLIVRVGRETAGFNGVFVKHLLGDRVGWSSQPRVVGGDGSCRRCRVRTGLAHDGDDIVRLKTNANHNSGADIGAAPPTPSAPELHPDLELLVSHWSRRRLTSD